MSNSFSITRTLSMASWIALTRTCTSGMCCCTSGRGQLALCRRAAEWRNMPNAGRSRGPNRGSVV
eukprot:14204941-Alexandrium_andersonii.AAC.1